MAEERQHTLGAPCAQSSTNSSLQACCSSWSRSTPCAETTQSLFASSHQHENYDNTQLTDGDPRPQDKPPEWRSPCLGELQHRRQDLGRDTRGLPNSPSHGITPIARFESEQRGDAPWNSVAAQYRQAGTSSRPEHPELSGIGTDDADWQNVTNAPNGGEKTEELRFQEPNFQEDITFVGGMFDSKH